MTDAPQNLWRNREFALLWISQSLSDLGTATAALAVPLLVLSLTHSPVQAGLVGTIGLVAGLACRLPAGVLVDRIDRRRAMLACDVVSLVAFLLLGLAVLRGGTPLGVVVAVAVIGTVSSSIFRTAEQSALRNLVPGTQLPAAVARNEARTYATSLAGPPLGGLLFGLGRALPFFGNAVTHLASLGGVLLLRKPLQETRDHTRGGHAAAMAEGLRFVYANPFLRAILLIAAPLNLAIDAIIFTIIVTLQRHGVAPALIGTVQAVVAAGGLLGAFAAPALQRRMRLPVLIRGICWLAAALMSTCALLTTSVAAAVPVALAVFLGPACNAALFGHQAAITPDRLQGRVVSVIFFAATSASAAAPLLAGVLIAGWGSTAAVIVFSLTMAGAAIAATVSRGIRAMEPVPERAG
ncbi:MFS transporter [Krasilnikovia sp. MM14-A1259]|uniref:MFS transporter n=1 Tax=Krasilnikovia sp. MM14-A1259 TaxID=3373539 RepID=UPI00381B28D5